MRPGIKVSFLAGVDRVSPFTLIEGIVVKAEVGRVKDSDPAVSLKLEVTEVINNRTLEYVVMELMFESKLLMVAEPEDGSTVGMMLVPLNYSISPDQSTVQFDFDQV